MIKRRFLLLGILAAVLAGSCLAAVTLGSAHLDGMDIFAAFFPSVSGQPCPETTRLILFELRLPRMTGAFLAGAGLSVAGLLLQSATGNALCGPNIIGVNSGAGLAVMLLLCFFPAGFFWIPAAAFFGAFGTTLLVLGLSFALGRPGSRSIVILAGVAVGTFLNAILSFLIQIFPDALSSYTSFSTGGFSGLSFPELSIPALLLFFGILCAWGMAPQLNLLCLGDELAHSLGVSVRRLRLTALALASLLCAAVVSFAGLLGFVGLVVPHMAHKIAGSDLRLLIPVCVLLGASLTILSDLAGRVLFSPAELPAGILTSALGAPFFLVLLFQKGDSYA